jgi:hypothetical protein
MFQFQKTGLEGKRRRKRKEQQDAPELDALVVCYATVMWEPPVEWEFTVEWDTTVESYFVKDILEIV